VTTDSFPNATRFVAESEAESQTGQFGLPRREKLIDRRALEAELSQEPSQPPIDEKEKRLVEGLMGLSIFVLVSTGAFVYFQERQAPAPAANSEVSVVEAPAVSSPTNRQQPVAKELDGIPLKPAISDGWFSEPIPVRPRRMSEPPEM
jgi:hypothetical protein